jgi:hypothetical protein
MLKSENTCLNKPYIYQLNTCYNLVLHVAEGEKAKGHSEKWELHSEKVPKAP